MTNLKLLDSPEPKKRKLNDVAQFIFVAFVPVWLEKYPNKKYYISGQDSKLVKDFLKENEGILEDIDEVQIRASLYIKDEFWDEMKHPAWGLCRHFNKYIPEVKKVVNRNLCRNCQREIPRTFGNICPECERIELCKK
jgi:hypothetical protein